MNLNELLLSQSKNETLKQEIDDLIRDSNLMQAQEGSNTFKSQEQQQSTLTNPMYQNLNTQNKHESSEEDEFTADAFDADYRPAEQTIKKSNKKSRSLSIASVLNPNVLLTENFDNRNVPQFLTVSPTFTPRARPPPAYAGNYNASLAGPNNPLKIANSRHVNKALTVDGNMPSFDAAKGGTLGSATSQLLNSRSRHQSIDAIKVVSGNNQVLSSHLARKRQSVVSAKIIETLASANANYTDLGRRLARGQTLLAPGRLINEHLKEINDEEQTEEQQEDVQDEELKPLGLMKLESNELVSKNLHLKENNSEFIKSSISIDEKCRRTDSLDEFIKPETKVSIDSSATILSRTSQTDKESNLQSIKENQTTDEQMNKSEKEDGEPEAPTLSLGERIVWPQTAGPEYGTVKWIGRMPKVSTNWTIGVEFDNAIGKGDGIYDGRRYFNAKENYAKFLPLKSVSKIEAFLSRPRSGTLLSRMSVSLKPGQLISVQRTSSINHIPVHCALNAPHHIDHDVHKTNMQHCLCNNCNHPCAHLCHTKNVKGSKKKERAHMCHFSQKPHNKLCCGGEDLRELIASGKLEKVGGLLQEVQQSNTFAIKTNRSRSGNNRLMLKQKSQRSSSESRVSSSKIGAHAVGNLGSAAIGAGFETLAISKSQHNKYSKIRKPNNIYSNQSKQPPISLTPPPPSPPPTSPLPRSGLNPTQDSSTLGRTESRKSRRSDLKSNNSCRANNSTASSLEKISICSSNSLCNKKSHQLVKQIKLDQCLNMSGNKENNRFKLSICKDQHNLTELQRTESELSISSLPSTTSPVEVYIARGALTDESEYESDFEMCNTNNESSKHASASNSSNQNYQHISSLEKLSANNLNTLQNKINFPNSMQSINYNKNLCSSSSISHHPAYQSNTVFGNHHAQPPYATKSAICSMFACLVGNKQHHASNFTTSSSKKENYSQHSMTSYYNYDESNLDGCVRRKKTKKSKKKSHKKKRSCTGSSHCYYCSSHKHKSSSQVTSCASNSIVNSIQHTSRQSNSLHDNENFPSNENFDNLIQPSKVNSTSENSISQNAKSEQTTNHYQSDQRLNKRNSQLSKNFCGLSPSPNFDSQFPLLNNYSSQHSTTSSYHSNIHSQGDYVSNFCSKTFTYNHSCHPECNALSNQNLSKEHNSSNCSSPMLLSCSPQQQLVSSDHLAEKEDKSALHNETQILKDWTDNCSKTSKPTSEKSLDKIMNETTAFAQQIQQTPTQMDYVEQLHQFQHQYLKQYSEVCNETNLYSSNVEQYNDRNNNDLIAHQQQPHHHHNQQQLFGQPQMQQPNSSVTDAAKASGDVGNKNATLAALNTIKQVCQSVTESDILCEKIKTNLVAISTTSNVPPQSNSVTLKNNIQPKSFDDGKPDTDTISFKSEATDSTSISLISLGSLSLNIQTTNLNNSNKSNLNIKEQYENSITTPNNNSISSQLSVSSSIGVTSSRTNASSTSSGVTCSPNRRRKKPPAPKPPGYVDKKAADTINNLKSKTNETCQTLMKKSNQANSIETKCDMKTSSSNSSLLTNYTGTYSSLSMNTSETTSITSLTVDLNSMKRRKKSSKNKPAPTPPVLNTKRLITNCNITSEPAAKNEQVQNQKLKNLNSKRNSYSNLMIRETVNCSNPSLNQLIKSSPIKTKCVSTSISKKSVKQRINEILKRSLSEAFRLNAKTALNSVQHSFSSEVSLSKHHFVSIIENNAYINSFGTDLKQTITKQSNQIKSNVKTKNQNQEEKTKFVDDNVCFSKTKSNLKISENKTKHYLKDAILDDLQVSSFLDNSSSHLNNSNTNHLINQLFTTKPNQICLNKRCFSMPSLDEFHLNEMILNENCLNNQALDKQKLQNKNHKKRTSNHNMVNESIMNAVSNNLCNGSADQLLYAAELLEEFSNQNLITMPALNDTLAALLSPHHYYQHNLNKQLLFINHFMNFLRDEQEQEELLTVQLIEQQQVNKLIDAELNHESKSPKETLDLNTNKFKLNDVDPKEMHLVLHQSSNEKNLEIQKNNANQENQEKFKSNYVGQNSSKISCFKLDVQDESSAGSDELHSDTSDGKITVKSMPQKPSTTISEHETSKPNLTINKNCELVNNDLSSLEHCANNPSSSYLNQKIYSIQCNCKKCCFIEENCKHHHPYAKQSDVHNNCSYSDCLEEEEENLSNFYPYFSDETKSYFSSSSSSNASLKEKNLNQRFNQMANLNSHYNHLKKNLQISSSEYSTDESPSNSDSSASLQIDLHLPLNRRLYSKNLNQFLNNAQSDASYAVLPICACCEKRTRRKERSIDFKAFNMQAAKLQASKLQASKLQASKSQSSKVKTSNLKISSLQASKFGIHSNTYLLPNSMKPNFTNYFNQNECLNLTKPSKPVSTIYTQADYLHSNLLDHNLNNETNISQLYNYHCLQLDDMFNSENNALLENKELADLMEQLEVAISLGEHKKAAILARELALRKVTCTLQRTNQSTISSQPIVVYLYIEDRNSHKGPIPLQVYPTMTVRILKLKIEKEFGYDVNMQKWILGKSLASNEDASLFTYGVTTSGCPIFLYLFNPDEMFANHKSHHHSKHHCEIDTTSFKQNTFNHLYEYNNETYENLFDISSDQNESVLTKGQTSKASNSLQNDVNGKTKQFEHYYKTDQNQLQECKNNVQINLLDNDKKKSNRKNELYRNYACLDSLKNQVTNKNKIDQQESLNITTLPKKNLSSQEVNKKFNKKIKQPNWINNKLLETNLKSQKLIEHKIKNLNQCKSTNENQDNKTENTIQEIIIEEVYELEADDDRLANSMLADVRLADDRKKKNYDNLIKLQNADLVTNVEFFECLICLNQLGIGEGVVLKQCLHSFCRNCLVNCIKHSEQPTVNCPFDSDEYQCNYELSSCEIRSLLKDEPEAYENYLRKSYRLASFDNQNLIFQCKTNNCDGFTYYDQSAKWFLCPICLVLYCLLCKEAHKEEQSCQMAINLEQKELSEEEKKSEAYIKEIIDKGQALKCPKCDVLVMKKWGCDWVKCSMCKIEICWITQKPRWGPGGKGDTSEGCKCMVNGKKCHPKCNYCH